MTDQLLREIVDRLVDALHPHAIYLFGPHDLAYLLRIAKALDDSFDRFVASAPALTDYAVRFRYPTQAPDQSLSDSREAARFARGIWQFVLDRLPAEVRPAP